MAEVIFTKENFDKEVLKNNDTVLVDFWAPWCGPCRTMAPIIENLANEMKGKKVKIGKVNVDEHAELAGKYGIMSIPAIFIFKGGKVVEKLFGLQNKDSLKEKLEGYIKE
ncbi:MAG: thioredoxin [bacterium]